MKHPIEKYIYILMFPELRVVVSLSDNIWFLPPTKQIVGFIYKIKPSTSMTHEHLVIKEK